MIGRQLNVVASTAQAFVTEVVAQVFELTRCVAATCLGFSRAAAAFIGGVDFGISLPIPASLFVYGIGVGVIIAEFSLPISVDIGLSPAADSLIYGAAIVLPVAVGILPPYFRVLLSVSAVAFLCARHTMAAFIPLASPASCTRLSVLGRHRKTPVAMPQELNYNRPATRRLPGLSSRLGVFTALPGHLLTLNYTTRGDLEPLGQVYFR